MNVNNMEWSSKINGEVRTLNVNPARRLLDMIREDLHMTGTKISCEMGRCGACMVLVDGEPMNACLMMAYQSHGKDITTIEGLHGENEGELHHIQEAYVEEGGFQCGYCTPGMIISTKALLDHHPNPTLQDIEEGLCGNLCRCTGYSGIIRAVQTASYKCLEASSLLEVQTTRNES
ncbi:carbon-monoxide dehydrogenase small subunit [Paenibacillus sp. DS2015]|uniref:(2Fe-2S)-binding protein n=1 Tax=Paenibacillus sp. DS2015 TaxID=3373917 RepID=UPI003D1ACF26